MPTLFKAVRSRCQPDFLDLYLGENDLVACSAVQLLDNLIRDITKIRYLMPGIRLVWANILSRHNWRSTHNNGAIDLARRKTNKQSGKIIGRNRRAVITQPSIHYGLLHIFWSDGIHQSSEGCEIYLANMAQGIKAAMWWS